VAEQYRLSLYAWENEAPSGVLAIRVCGEQFEAHPSGALYHAAERTLIVSDLHLEQGAALAARGHLIPPYDTHSTLERLAQVIAHFDPVRVISLGDSFHDVGVAERLSEEALTAIARLQAGREWYWIAGNHDPDLPASLHGHVVPSLTLGSLRYVHEPVAGPAVQEVAGHLHPAARVSRRGRTVRRKCFITDSRRLVMPAFGAYTGGLNVLDRAFAPLFASSDFTVWALGRDDVYPVTSRYLQPDR
jgi:hypothetical protein